MTIREEQWRVLLQKVLAQYDRHTAKTLALAAVVSWEQLSARLTPLLGPESVYLIYRRSLDLNKSVFPWLPMESNKNTYRANFEDLRRSLETQPVEDGLQANFALLYTFVEVLAALIGERLATDFLRSAFPMPLPTDRHQEDQQ